MVLVRSLNCGHCRYAAEWFAWFHCRHWHIVLLVSAAVYHCDVSQSVYSMLPVFVDQWLMSVALLRRSRKLYVRGCVSCGWKNAGNCLTTPAMTCQQSLGWLRKYVSTFSRGPHIIGLPGPSVCHPSVPYGLNLGKIKKVVENHNCCKCSPGHE